MINSTSFSRHAEKCFAGTADLLTLQHKVVFMIINESVFFHTGQFQRKTAALHRKIVCHLLAGKGNVKFKIIVFLRDCRKIREQLCACRALRHVRKFLITGKVFRCQVREKIPNDPAVVGTCR